MPCTHINRVQRKSESEECVGHKRVITYPESTYLQCTRENLKLMAMPIDFLLLWEPLKELTGDDVLKPYEASIGLV